MKYGLIGERLGHSYSKIIHEKLADYQYDLMPLEHKELDAYMKAKDFKAINVTIPYKQEVIPYLDELHPHALEIGAVNTIVNKNGKLYGYNTDYYGFRYMIEHNKIDIKEKKCAVLGNGGAAKAVIAVLRHLKAKDILLVSRNKSDNTITYDECIEEHSDTQVIVNTTPVGMYPNTDASPIDLSNFHSCEAVLDVIYNPIKTKLTLQAEERNIKALTGLEMLIAQAKAAVEYFLDVKLEDDVMETIYQELIKTLS